MSENDKNGVVPTPEQIRRRDQRNRAIGWALFFFAVLFFIITLIKGPAVLNRGF